MKRNSTSHQGLPLALMLTPLLRLPLLLRCHCRRCRASNRSFGRGLGKQAAIQPERAHAEEE